MAFNPDTERSCFLVLTEREIETFFELYGELLLLQELNGNGPDNRYAALFDRVKKRYESHKQYSTPEAIAQQEFTDSLILAKFNQMEAAGRCMECGQKLPREN